LNIHAMGGFSVAEQNTLVDRLSKVKQNLKKMHPRPAGRVRGIAAKRPMSSPATELLGSDTD
jgi:hypothetical protein